MFRAYIYKLFSSREHFFELCLLFSSKGEPVYTEDIFVAVKTCRKFHSERGKSQPITESAKDAQFPLRMAEAFVLLFSRNGFVLP